MNTSTAVCYSTRDSVLSQTDNSGSKRLQAPVRKWTNLFYLEIIHTNPEKMYLQKGLRGPQNLWPG